MTFAHRLRARRDRRQLDPRGTAAALRNLVDAADEPDSYWLAQGIEPPLRAGAIRAARDDLRAIATLLERAVDIPDQAIACAAWLAWSQESPICSDPAPDADVPDVARRLRHWLSSL